MVLYVVKKKPITFHNQVTWQVSCHTVVMVPTICQTCSMLSSETLHSTQGSLGFQVKSEILAVWPPWINWREKIRKVTKSCSFLLPWCYNSHSSLTNTNTETFCQLRLLTTNKVGLLTTSSPCTILTLWWSARAHKNSQLEQECKHSSRSL